MLPRPRSPGSLASQYYNKVKRNRCILNIDISQKQNADLKETLVCYIHDEPDANITPDILEFSLWKKSVQKMHYMQQMQHLLSRGGKSC